jgi:putative ABC transport system permease protein
MMLLTPPFPAPAEQRLRRIALALRLAWREQRNGLSGFYVFIACVALGVAVITGVGALADALEASFEHQGETLLGGDVTLSRPHQPLEGEERAWLWRQGRVSESASMRAMARQPGGEEQALVELKGVDEAYPLVGALSLSPERSLDATIRSEPAAAIDPILLDRLGLKLGDKLSLGRIDVPIVATIVAEPDRLTERLTVGPRVLVSIDTLRRTGLIDPGSLVTWRYAVKLDGPVAASAHGALAAFRGRIREAIPEGGFTVRDRRNPSPQLTRTLERLRQFLTLVGVTSLLVGGVGIANAIATYIDRRRKVIATFKSLGATGDIIFTLHLLQVLLVSAIGIALGIALGLLIPIALNAMIGDVLPIRADFAVGMRSLLTAVAYGVLVTLLFTLWPLGRAEQVRAAVLFRDEVAPEATLPRRRIILLTLVTALALAAFAILTSESRLLASYYCLGVLGVFAVFVGLAAAIARLARHMPRPRRPELALAIGNLGAPGGLTRSVVLSLGAGLSLLVTVAQVDHAIVLELTGRLPHDSPNYFVLDLRNSELDAFHALVERDVPFAKIQEAPMLRGRLVKLGNRPAEQIKAPPEAQWVLNGDRGLTYAQTAPEGSSLVAGTWWPADYAGEPLVSFEAEIARGLGLDIGDTVTVNVLGRNVVARIANLREVRWESLNLNFVMVFSPNTLAGAPHTLLATVTLPRDTPLAAEADLARDIGRAFPAATAIRVKDALEAFNVVFGRIMVAVRAAGSVTLLAGAVVLAGALATAQRRRIQQAVILKTLGASSGRILLSHLIEYLLLAFCTSFISLLIGSLAAWATLRRVMEIEFAFSPATAASAILLAIAMVALLGGFGTWRVLQAPPVPYLRAE